MKNIYLSMMAVALFFAACNNAPEGEKAVVAEAQEVTTIADGTIYNLQDGSTISFYGATPTHGQNGTFPATGALIVTGGNITGGNAMVELANMVVTTEGLEDNKKEKLKAHLLNEDFFNATANPTISFEITKVEMLDSNAVGESTVSGNLTMNGQTNNVSFPAKILLDENKLSAKASFVINRKNWGMSYKNNKSLGDEWIYDDVKITLDIKVAK